jgi:hypothetical protein
LFTIFDVGIVTAVPLIFHRGLKPRGNLSFMQCQKVLNYLPCIARYRLLFVTIIVKQTARLRYAVAFIQPIE